ncbi:hypothetical protein [Aneurinibacillus tyrosinisolvens]|uniref:hypothetical protein n=1 Tax=Aneurinibacillus tyrosinisolvens TaxID=1443435 RepID=UPI00063FD0BB|nr:hypothetical protein [Aneurinibacillus tyrosinisolvens]
MNQQGELEEKTTENKPENAVIIHDQVGSVLYKYIQDMNESIDFSKLEKAIERAKNMPKLIVEYDTNLPNAVQYGDMSYEMIKDYIKTAKYLKQGRIVLPYHSDRDMLNASYSALEKALNEAGFQHKLNRNGRFSSSMKKLTAEVIEEGLGMYTVEVQIGDDKIINNDMRYESFRADRQASMKTEETNGRERKEPIKFWFVYLDQAEEPYWLSTTKDSEEWTQRQNDLQANNTIMKQAELRYLPLLQAFQKWNSKDTYQGLNEFYMVAKAFLEISAYMIDILLIQSRLTVEQYQKIQYSLTEQQVLNDIAVSRIQPHLKENPHGNPRTISQLKSEGIYENPFAHRNYTGFKDIDSYEIWPRIRMSNKILTPRPFEKPLDSFPKTETEALKGYLGIDLTKKELFPTLAEAYRLISLREQAVKMSDEQAAVEQIIQGCIAIREKAKIEAEVRKEQETLMTQYQQL